MRIYFAYRLNKPISVRRAHSEEPFKALYRLGISNTTEHSWRLGLYVGDKSNIHRVYETAWNHNILDTELAPPGENQHIPREGSVFATPVTYGQKSIGVIGISSPQKQETKDYVLLGNQLAVIFGALTYAYTMRLRDRLAADQIVERLREEISDHFEGELGGGQSGESG